MPATPMAPAVPATGWEPQVPFVITAVAALAALWGLSTDAFNYAISSMVFAVAVMVVEIDRKLRRPEVPWWVTNSLLFPWAGLVLLPWTLRLASNAPWLIASGQLPVARGLPNTWLLNLLVLVGFTLGTLFTGRGRSAAETPLWSAGARLSGSRLVLALAALVGSYLVSFAMTGRPLAAMWLLSGDYIYSGVKQTRVGFAFLDLAPVACVALVLATTAFRREQRASPPLSELAILLVTLVLVLGSGVRSWVYMLGFGWLVIQFRLGFIRRTRRRKVALGALLVAFTLAAFFAVGYIGVLRSGQSAGDHDIVQASIMSIDVIGTQERLGALGVQPGSLNGRSYTELPRLFLPRKITGQQSKVSAAQQVINGYLDPRAGYSAPLWFEAALNAGLVMLFVMMVVLAALAVSLQIRAAAARSPVARLVPLCGPAIMLAIYLFLSRLILFQTLVTLGSLFAGAWIATRCVTRRPVGGPSEVSVIQNVRRVGDHEMPRRYSAGRLPPPDRTAPVPRQRTESSFRSAVAVGPDGVEIPTQIPRNTGNATGEPSLCEEPACRDGGHARPPSTHTF